MCYKNESAQLNLGRDYENHEQLQNKYQWIELTSHWLKIKPYRNGEGEKEERKGVEGRFVLCIKEVFQVINQLPNPKTFTVFLWC